MTTPEALNYLDSIGVRIQDAPSKWRRRGFYYYAPEVGQMLRADDLREFAANELDLRS